MPELPEVETVRRGLAPMLIGRRIAAVEVRRADLRVPFPDRFAERLTGRRVTALERRAKYLLAVLDNDTVLIVHLGMSGRFVIAKPSGTAEREAHDHVIIDLDSHARLVYNDARRFGLMTLTNLGDLDQHPLLRDVGVEPLSDAFNGAHLDRVLTGKRTPIKAALLDQHVVAGLGNIYACEALYRARVSPRRLSSTVPGKRAERLAAAIRRVLNDALAAGGSTLRDYVGADGEFGYFQHDFAVYDREGATCATPGCGATIRRIVQSGRSTFYCGACQR